MKDVYDFPPEYKGRLSTCYNCGYDFYCGDEVYIIWTFGREVHPHMVYICEDCSDPEISLFPPIPQGQRDMIVNDPFQWQRERLDEARRANQTVGDEKKYFITFTTDPSKGITKEKFLLALKHAMSLSGIMEFSLVIENEDSNMHAHARVVTKQYLKRQKYAKAFQKKVGFIDIRQIKHDNDPNAAYFIGLNDVMTSFDEINSELLKMV